MPTKKSAKKPKKKSVVRKPTGGSAVSAVMNSPQAADKAKNQPAVAAIVVQHIGSLTPGANSDFAQLVASKVLWAGAGTLVFTPPLTEIGLPRKYTITATVTGIETPPEPALVQFEILPVDPQLKVAGPLEFTYGEFADPVSEIRSRVTHKSTYAGEVTFDPPLDDEAGEPGYLDYKVSIPADGLYKKGLIKKFRVTVLKAEPKLTIGKVAEMSFADDKATLNIRKAVKVDRGEAGKHNELLVFQPALDKIQDPGTYDIYVYLPESDHYVESAEEIVKVTIKNTGHFKSTVCGDWEKANQTYLNQNPQAKKKVTELLYAMQLAQSGYDTRAEIVSALNGAAGVPTRVQVWAALGYTLKSNQWDMPEKWDTPGGRTFHLTISANSMIVPTTRAEWSAAPAALFDLLFLSPPIANRVHLTLEDGGRHLFLGGVTGANKVVGDDWWNGSAAHMKPKLAEFRTRMIQQLAAFKATLNL